jgi:hypothetical protein
VVDELGCESSKSTSSSDNTLGNDFQIFGESMSVHGFWSKVLSNTRN